MERTPSSSRLSPACFHHPTILAGFDSLFRYTFNTELRRLGVNFVSDTAFRDFFATYVAVDGTIVTGQNQNSSAETAQTLLLLRDARALYDGHLQMANDGTPISLPVNSDQYTIHELLGTEINPALQAYVFWGMPYLSTSTWVLPLAGCGRLLFGVYF